MPGSWLSSEKCCPRGLSPVNLPWCGEMKAKRFLACPESVAAFSSLITWRSRFCWHGSEVKVEVEQVEARLTGSFINHGREEFILVRLDGSDLTRPEQTGSISILSRANAISSFPGPERPAQGMVRLHV